MSKTTIAWATHSLNPGIDGCTEVSRGCLNCYAAQLAHRWGGAKRGITVNRGRKKGGVHWTGVVRVAPIGDALAKIRAFPRVRGYRPRVFVTSMADVLHAEVPLGWTASLVRAMALRDDVDWLLLSKRAERWPELARVLLDQVGAWPANVWAGVTIESRKALEERAPLLAQVPAKVRWWSCEPLVEDLGDLSDYLQPGHETNGPAGWVDDPPDVHWLVAGGESGPRATPAHPDWFRSIRDQCELAGIDFLFKQWGTYIPRSHTDRRHPWHAERTPDQVLARVDEDPDHPDGGMYSWRTWRVAAAGVKASWGVVTSTGLWTPTGTPFNGHDDDGYPNDASMYGLGVSKTGRYLDGKIHHQLPGDYVRALDAHLATLTETA